MTSNSHNGAMLSPTPAAIETASGRFVDLLFPDPATIHVDDVAHALALTCRYGGHVSRFYSVAEHSVLVARLLRSDGHPREIQLAGLLHDAAEAYLGDVVAPMKFALRAAEFEYPGAIHRASSLADFRGPLAGLEQAMDSAIGEALRTDPSLWTHPDVKLADMWALRIEASALTHTGGANWRWPGELPHGGRLPADVEIPAGGAEARREWLAEYDLLRYPEPHAAETQSEGGDQ